MTFAPVKFIVEHVCSCDESAKVGSRLPHFSFSKLESQTARLMKWAASQEIGTDISSWSSAPVLSAIRHANSGLPMYCPSQVPPEKEEQIVSHRKHPPTHISSKAVHLHHITEKQIMNFFKKDKL